MLQVSKNIRDQNSNGYDLNDFRAAMYMSVAAGEDALRVAIDQVFSAMTPPASQVAPQPPAVVDGFPFGCVSGYSTYNVFWSASSGANGYNVYASGQYLATTPSTSGYLYTLNGTVMRVAAYNSFGTSGLSADSFNAPAGLCG